jgi:hypothetical protein
MSDLMTNQQATEMSFQASNRRLHNPRRHAKDFRCTDKPVICVNPQTGEWFDSSFVGINAWTIPDDKSLKPSNLQH